MSGDANRDPAMMTDESTTATVEHRDASTELPTELMHHDELEATQEPHEDSIPEDSPPEVAVETGETVEHPEVLKEVAATTALSEPVDTVAPPEPPVGPAVPAVPTKNWYVIKVQSGREDSIRNALLRRIKIDSLEEYIGRILIPTEKVVEMVRGKRVTKKRKKFPGYLMVEIEFNDKILFLFRETAGVGDFVGGSMNRLPAPMGAREVERMLADEDDGTTSKEGKSAQESPKVVVKVQKGDRVKVQSGTFAGMEGEVKEVIYAADPKETPRVKVEVVIWGRPVSMDIEYFFVDLVE